MPLFARRLICALLVIFLAQPQIVVQSFFAYPNVLSPTSLLQQEKQNQPLTSTQESTLKEVFLNTELKDYLDRMVERVLRNVGDKFVSDFIQVSQVRVRRDLEEDIPVTVDPHQAPQKDKDKKRTRGPHVMHKFQPLQEWLNASLTEHLLREIRLREITCRNKMRLEGKTSDEIEAVLQEIREVMPTQGIEVYLVKGCYLLAFKKFLLVIHRSEENPQDLFPDLQQKGEIIFRTETFQQWNLTVFQMPRENLVSMCQKWGDLEPPKTPTKEMINTLENLNDFLPYFERTLRGINQGIELLQRITKVPRQSRLPANSTQLLKQLDTWRGTLRQMVRKADAYKVLPGKNTNETIRKISYGMELLNMIRNFTETLISETSREEGLLFVKEPNSEDLVERFNLDKLERELNLPDSSAAKKALVDLLTKLEKDAFQLSNKLIQLRTIAEVKEVNLIEILQNVLYDYRADAQSHHIEFDLQEVPERNLSVGTLPVQLSLVLDKMMELILAQLKAVEGAGNKKVTIQCMREKGGEGKIRVALMPSLGASTGGQSRLTRKFFLDLGLREEESPLAAMASQIQGEVDFQENGSLILKIPSQLNRVRKETLKIRSLPTLEGITTLPTGQFYYAYDRYVNQFSNRAHIDFFPRELKAELEQLNQKADLTLEAYSSASGRPVRQLLNALFFEEQNHHWIGKVDPRWTLRQIADKTGLRLSKVVERLQIPRQMELLPPKIPMITIYTHQKGKQKRNIGQELDLEKIRKNRDDLGDFTLQDLVVLRLITRDPAGNFVEHLVIDRLGRLQEFSSTLGQSSSFNKFLFNARRTFDPHEREIIFDEIYLDPQQKGYGSWFYRAQMRAFREAGFAKKERAAIRIREDTVSLVTLNWFQGAQIDWERLAFREHWLHSMAALFEELGITTPTNPTPENLRQELKTSKQNSDSFNEFLENAFDVKNYPERMKSVQTLLESDVEGFVDYLRFRLIGYGRRCVRLEKLKAALKELPEKARQEREEGLSILQNLKARDEYYRVRTQEAEKKLTEGREKTGLLQVNYPPDFSKGSPDRRRANLLAEELLQRHEFSLSLVGNLSTQQSQRFEIHEVLNKMLPYLTTAEVTVTPHPVKFLEKIDVELERYQRHWKWKEWPKPTALHLRVAKEFHQIIEDTYWPISHRIITSFFDRKTKKAKRVCRFYFPEISSRFFDFVQKSLGTEKPQTMGNVLYALFYYSPQLAGIVLRSAHAHQDEARNAFSKFQEGPYSNDSAIARFLDLEVMPVPRDSDGRNNFHDTDQFLILNLLEPNELSDEKYSRRVRKVLKLVQPETLAFILQQSYVLYHWTPDQTSPEMGWIESVFLAALRGMENDGHFKEAMDILKNDLKEEKAWEWVDAFFKRETRRKEVSADEFVRYVSIKLRQSPPQERLGKKYSRSVYGAFMNNCNGYTQFDTEKERKEKEGAVHKSAAEILSEIYRLNPEIAKMILRSTSEGQDRYTAQILIRMPMEEIVAILTSELDFIVESDVRHFKDRDKDAEKDRLFVFLIVLGILLKFANEKDETVSETWVQTLLNSLDPRTLAVLVEHMWLNRANGRFKNLNFTLKQMLDYLDETKKKEMIRHLEDWAQAHKTPVTKWLKKKLGIESYAKEFFEELKREYPWLEEEGKDKREELKEKLHRWSALLEKPEAEATKSAIKENLKEVLLHLKNLVMLLESDQNLNGALLAYSKAKLELNRIRKEIMEDLEPSELNPSQRELFLFNILEPELNRLFLDLLNREGIQGLQSITAGKGVFRVKVVPARPEFAHALQEITQAELLITDQLPVNNPLKYRPGAMLVGIPVSEKSHAYRVAQEHGIPLAFLPCAEEILESLQGKVLVLESGPGPTRLRRPTPEELQQFNQESSKSNIQVELKLEKMDIPDVCLGADERLVINLQEMKPRDRNRTGYKAVRLARIKDDFNVPDGFSITYAGYEAFLRHNNGMEEEIRKHLRGIDDQDPAEVSRRLRAIRQLYVDGEFPPELVREIQRELMKLGEVPVHVRSSSNVEDIPKISGAGRLDSFPMPASNAGVILSRIKDVMLSMWAEKAFYYRRLRGVRGEEHLKARVSVFVQKTVDTVYSGLFETRYRGQDPAISITIDEGMGAVVEDKVKGRVSPVIVYDGKTERICRRFEDHPLFWEDATIGLADLVTAIKKIFAEPLFPDASTNEPKQIPEKEMKQIILAVLRLHRMDEMNREGMEDKVAERISHEINNEEQIQPMRRLFNEDPLFWENLTFGFSELVESTRKKLIDPTRRTKSVKEEKEEKQEKEKIKAIILAALKFTRGELNGEIRQLLKSFSPGLVSPDQLIAQIQEKLCAIDQEQRRKLFKPLAEMGAKIEEKFGMQPLEIEFALDREGQVIPLQVKGLYGTHKVTFEVLVLNRYGLHARPSTDLSDVMKYGEAAWEGDAAIRTLRQTNPSGYSRDNRILIEVNGETKRRYQSAIGETNHIFGLMTLGLQFGEIARITVAGRNATTIAKAIRRIFMELAENDYDSKELIKGLSLPPWEKVKSVISCYFEEDDEENPIPWDDLEKWEKFYLDLYQYSITPPESELEAAI